MKKVKRSKIKYHLSALIIVFLFSLLGAKALFHSGLYTAHDIWHNVARFYHYTQALSEGRIFPSWMSNLQNGYGYPLFIFSYHLPWLVGFPLLKVGLSFETAFKALFFISYLGSGVAMYFLSRKFFKSKLAAVVSTLLYLWAPYHFLTMFVSASIGTAFVFVFVPLIVLGALYAIDTHHKAIIFIAFGLAGGILSHLITLTMVLPFLLLFYLIVAPSSKKQVKKTHFLLVSGLILGIGVAFYYLLPAIFYMPYLDPREAGLDKLYARHFVTLNQLTYSRWGYGVITEDARNGEISFQVGIAQWLGIGLVSLLALKKSSTRRQAIAIVFPFSLSIIAMTIHSKPIWDILIKYITFDFPFRLLLISVFFGSLAGGFAVTQIKSPLVKYSLSIFLIFVALYTNRNHTRVNEYTYFPVSDYIGAEINTTTLNEYLPKSVINPPPSEKFGQKYTAVFPLNLKSKNVKHTTDEVTFTLINKEVTGSVYLGQYAFPGNRLYINSKEYNALPDKRYGLMNVSLPRGEYHVTIRYQPTTIMRLGLIISAISLITIIILIKKLPRKRYEGHRRLARLQRR